MLASKNNEKIRAMVLLDPPINMRRTSKALLPIWETLHTIAEEKGTVQDRIKYIEGLDIEMFDSSDVYYWAQNYVDPSILEELIKSIEDEVAADLYYSWYDPEKLVPLITCPVLLIQAGIGDVLLESEVQLAKERVKDIVHIKLENHDHGLGITD